MPWFVLNKRILYTKNYQHKWKILGKYFTSDAPTDIQLKAFDTQYQHFSFQHTVYNGNAIQRFGIQQL